MRTKLVILDPNQFPYNEPAFVEWVTAHGFSVEHFDSLSSAAMLLTYTEDIAVVIVELLLAVTDVSALSERVGLRAVKLCKTLGLPVVVSTCVGNDPTMTSAKEHLPANRLLQKPYPISKLLEALEEALETSN